MTILKAKFESKCETAYPEDEKASDGSLIEYRDRHGNRIGRGELELCDGIKVGDEIIYQIVDQGHSYDRRSWKRTSVGHVTCRAEEYDRKVIDFVRKIGADALSLPESRWLDNGTVKDEDKIKEVSLMTAEAMDRHMERWTEQQRLRVRPESSNLFKTEKETA